MEPEKYATCIACKELYTADATCEAEVDGVTGFVCGGCAYKIQTRSDVALKRIADGAGEEEK